MSRDPRKKLRTHATRPFCLLIFNAERPMHSWSLDTTLGDYCAVSGFPTTCAPSAPRHIAARTPCAPSRLWLDCFAAQILQIEDIHEPSLKLCVTSLSHNSILGSMVQNINEMTSFAEFFVRCGMIGAGLVSWIDFAWQLFVVLVLLWVW